MISLSYTFDRVGFPRFGKEKYLKVKKKKNKKRTKKKQREESKYSTCNKVWKAYAILKHNPCYTVWLMQNKNKYM
jgi:hypothetical protein